MKRDSLQSDRLQFQVPSPFLTQQRVNDPQSDTKMVETKSEGQLGQTQIAFTNICFEDVQKDSSKQSKVSRIHGKQTIKKIGLAHFALMNKQRKRNNLEKEINNTTLKSSIKQSSKKLIHSRSRQFPSEMLESRSIQLEEQLSTILKNRKQNERIQKNKDIQKHHRFTTETMAEAAQGGNINLVFSVPEKETKQQQSINYAQSLISLRQDKEEMKEKRKEENGFYKKLKSKLQLQMRKIQDKKTNRQNLLLQGCQIVNAKSKSQEKRPLTDRPRPNTALARTGLEIHSSKASLTDRRPSSSRSRSLQRRQLIYMSQQLDEPPRKRKYKSTKENKSTIPYEPATNKTYKYVSQIHKKSGYPVTKGELQKEKVKEKMLDILINCEKETVDFINLQAGFKAFESYTKRMNKGLKDTSNIISGQYKMPTEDQQSYFS